MDVYDEDIIQKLRHNADTVRRLVQHPRNKRIVNTNQAYYYKSSSGQYQVLSGLLPRLRKTFYPTTNVANLAKQPKSLHTFKGSKKKKPREKKKKPSSAGKGWHYGKIRGTVVHRELQDFILLDKRQFMKIHRGLHPYTYKILYFIMETMKWDLLRPEFDIFDEDLLIGTSVDIVAVTKQGKLVLIEVKCGYAEYFDRYEGYMHRSLHKLTDSPHHQANLQIITAALMIHKRHEIPLDKMELYVLRVDDQGLDPYLVQNDYVRRKGPKIYQDLALFK